MKKCHVRVIFLKQIANRKIKVPSVEDNPAHPRSESQESIKITPN